MDMSIIEPYKVLPYINFDTLVKSNGRQILIAPFYEDNTFQYPVFSKDKNRIIFLKGILSQDEGLYIAKEINDKNQDAYFKIVDFMYRYCSYPNIIPHLGSLIDNYINIFTVVSKIDSYLDLVNKIRKSMISDFIKTDFEYVFMIGRIAYDILQQIVSTLWNGVKLVDKSETKKLPTNFTKIIMKPKNAGPRTAEEISTVFNLPSDFANFYIEQVNFFEKLKTLRDDLVHNPETVKQDLFFVFNEGFGISDNSKLFKQFDIWDKHDCKTNNIYSIRPLLHCLVSNIMNASECFCDCIMKAIIFPYPIIDNYYVFLRHPHIRNFRNMCNELEKSSWW